MNLQKLITLRDGHRRVIAIQLEKFNRDITHGDAADIIVCITQKADIIKGLNDKIINHPDTEDIATELVQSEEYSIDLGLQIKRLEKSWNSATPPTTDSAGTSTERQKSNDATVGMEEHTTGDSVSTQLANNTRYSCNTNHKLPQLTLPEFSGEITQWQTFWDCFESAVHTNETLSDVQKFNYLRSLLHGDAASAIAGFPLTNANYGNAIQLLQQRFGKPHKIKSTYMQCLVDLPAPDNRVNSLRQFQDKMETSICGLESLGQFTDSYGELLVPILKEKLPSELRRHIARELGGDTSWSLSELRRAIEREINIMEAGHSQRSNGSHQHMPTASFFAGVKQNGTRRMENNLNSEIRSCVFCGKQHSVINCPEMNSLQDKRDVVKAKGLCFNCLGKHRVAFCRSTNRCRHCNRKHHTSLCEQPTSAGHTHFNTPLNQDAVPFQHPASCTDTSILHSGIQNGPKVLLKTAIGQVSSSHRMTAANILLDEGSQRSFITEKLAADLNLQYNGSESVSLSSFGGSTQQPRRLPTANVQLHLENGEAAIIDVLVVPTIAAPFDSFRSEISNMDYLKGLKLAHPVTVDGAFDVALLIGTDYYWDIVQNRVVRGNGPTAVESKLGYLISGPLPHRPSKTETVTLHMSIGPIEDLELEAPKRRYLETSTHEADSMKGKPVTSDTNDFSASTSHKRHITSYTNRFHGRRTRRAASRGNHRTFGRHEHWKTRSNAHWTTGRNGYRTIGRNEPRTLGTRHTATENSRATRWRDEPGDQRRSHSRFKDCV